MCKTYCIDLGVLRGWRLVACNRSTEVLRVIGLLGISVTAFAAPIPAPSHSQSFELPLAFELNRGQTDARVDFLARNQNYTLFLTATEAVFASSASDTARSQQSYVMRMQLIGSARDAQVRGLDELPGKIHYLLGENTARWHTNIPTYQRVAYQQVYPGIDLIYYGQSRQLEYDFVVKPGADPSTVKLAFSGVEHVTIAESGDLVLATPREPLRLRKPVLYQLDGERRVAVDGGYVITAQHEIGFRVGSYDRTRPLIIDPVLNYSTHLGGSADDGGEGIAVDPTGAAYVAGSTFSMDFPLKRPAQATHEGFQRDAFIAKLRPDGKALVYATYIGGTEDDVARDVAIDRGGAVYFTGFTDSSDFPNVRGFPADSCAPGEGATSRDIFVAKLAASGSRLIYATCLGGDREDFGQAIAVDRWGTAYVGGLTFSCNFPTVNAFAAECHNPGSDDLEAFVAKFKLTRAGLALVYSTYFGGTGADGAEAIAVDAKGAIHIAGFTTSHDFPIVRPVQPVKMQFEDGDAFATKIAPDGKTLIFSSQIGGGAGDGATGIAIDKKGAVYVTGNTGSDDLPTVNALQPNYAGNIDGFIAKLPPKGGSMIYSTYLGSSGRDESFDIAVDAAGAAYVTGWTFSPDFPAAIIGPGDNGDAYVAKLRPSGAALAYGTRLGGSLTDQGSAIAVDLVGAAYFTGFTYSEDFPTKNPIQPPGSSGIITDAFVTRIQGDKRRVWVDIKPGTFPNPVNCKSNGVIPVAIISTATFDATSIIPLSVRFGPGFATEAHGKAHIEDVNLDGRYDLLLHFRTERTGVQCGDAFASLIGKTLDGRHVRGADQIQTFGRKHH